jgi:hypothetical protein
MHLPFSCLLFFFLKGQFRFYKVFLSLRVGFLQKVLDSIKNLCVIIMDPDPGA